MKTRIIAMLLCAGLLFGGCTPEKEEVTVNYPQEVQNLEKLCKVWGYTKYTHPAFLVEGKDWDAELISLIPQVQEMNSGEEVNELLNDWLLSLGEVEFESDTISSVWSDAKEEDIVVVADTSWIFDEDYLGEELSANMIPLTEPIPEVNRISAPINFDRNYYGYGTTFTMYSTEKQYEDMDFGDDNYRLLGVFRLWNAIEYYCPNLETFDNDWEDMLPVFISKMLENSDEQSYHLTIAEMAANLQDAHVCFGIAEFLKNVFGENWVGDVEFTYAEGEVVVVQTFDEDCPLQAGDIIRKLDGMDIEDRIELGKKYCSVPDDDKFVNALELYLLRSDGETAEITVLRDGQEMTFTVEADGVPYDTGLTYGVNYEDRTPEGYEITEENIGVLNPKFLGGNTSDEYKYYLAMSAVKDTDGLIIDLRQYPGFNKNVLSGYIYDEPEVAMTSTYFSQTLPGVYVKEPWYRNTTQLRSTYHYDKEIVVLIDENSQSAPEFAALFLRGAENVTFMGSNTVGAVGMCLVLPLPDGHGLMYTAQSTYTLDGELTNRVGIAPDIEVKRTIQGIKEGRDELKEAAIEYLIREK